MQAKAQNLVERAKVLAQEGPVGQREAYRLMVQADGLGNSEAAYALGNWHIHGIVVDKNEEIAADYFERAARGGNRDAIYDLAFSYYSGKGRPKDVAKAQELYLRAAEMGDADAAFSVGTLMEDPDSPEAVAWYRRAAEMGSAEGQYAMGWAFEYGEGVDRNVELAMKWYAMAAKQGHTDAKVALDDLAGGE